MPLRDRRIPDLVSAAEAAAILGVTRQAIQQWATDDVLRGAKVGSTWVFRRETVESLRTFREAEARDANRTADGDQEA